MPRIAAILGGAVIATSGGCVPSLARVEESWQARESTRCYASRNTALLAFTPRALILTAIPSKRSSPFIKWNWKLGKFK